MFSDLLYYIFSKLVMKPLRGTASIRWATTWHHCVDPVKEVKLTLICYQSRAAFSSYINILSRRFAKWRWSGYELAMCNSAQPFVFEPMSAISLGGCSAYFPSWLNEWDLFPSLLFASLWGHCLLQLAANTVSIVKISSYDVFFNTCNNKGVVLQGLY